jgi:hypothetical protein
MKRHLSMPCLILFTLLMIQFPCAWALQRTYTWYIPSGQGGRDNEYEISLITSEGWQVDTPFDVTFRLTLVYKSFTLTDTNTDSVKIILTSENFVTDSGTQEETVVLRNVGDYWEKIVSFNIPAEKVPRGQSVDVDITYVVKIDTIATNHVAYRQTTNNYYAPMQTSLSRPYLSFLEWICVVAAVVVVGGLSGFIIYRRRLASAKARRHPPQ